MSPFELVVYFGLAVAVYLYISGNKSRSKNYPPGPWGFPILGHLPRMGAIAHKVFMDWAKVYGPIFAVDFGSYPTIILNDPKLIREAFNNHDISGRPELNTFSGRSDGKVEGVILTDGKKWLEQRRFIMRTLRDFGFGKSSMEVIVQEEIKDLIEGFRKGAGKPISTQNQFNAAVVNALWTIVAGERFKQDDPDLKTAIKYLSSSVQDNNVAQSISQFIPILARIAPKLSGFEQLLKDQFPVIEFVKGPIDQHKATYQPGQPRDFIDVYLDEIEKTTDPSSSFYKDQGYRSILFSVFDLFIAGAETTSTTLTWTFLYLAKFPEVQKKLQDEIQRVVGDSRLPSLSDRPNMPYTEAVIHEIMRYSTLVPLGVMHNTNRDVEIGGYTIPKNTMIMANQYGVHHDKAIWGDPENFRPERFLNKAGVFVKHEAFIAFSVGKRACLGETLARDELFLFTTSLFQAFKISPAGSIEDLPLEPKVGGVLFPQKHELILTERH